MERKSEKDKISLVNGKKRIMHIISPLEKVEREIINWEANWC